MTPAPKLTWNPVNIVILQGTFARCLLHRGSLGPPDFKSSKNLPPGLGAFSQNILPLGIFSSTQKDMDLGKNLLLILTRNPELGKCKTRLAAEVGEGAALEIYKFLLAHTRAVTKDLKVDKRVLYSNEVREDDIWDSQIYQKRLQRGADLGERMEHAFREGFRDGYHNILIIGSDLYDLATGDLEKAFTQLETHDFVVGPALDGGYYLLGMKSMKEELFHNKFWSTDSVLSDTLGDLNGESIALLPERNDVDLFEDIRDQEVFAPFIKHTKT